MVSPWVNPRNLSPSFTEVSYFKQKILFECVCVCDRISVRFSNGPVSLLYHTVSYSGASLRFLSPLPRASVRRERLVLVWMQLLKKPYFLKSCACVAQWQTIREQAGDVSAVMNRRCLRMRFSMCWSVVLRKTPSDDWLRALSGLTVRLSLTCMPVKNKRWRVHRAW